MNDPDARRIDGDQAFDVALGFARNSDDRVRHFERGLLNPEGKIVARRQVARVSMAAMAPANEP
jgi:uncharacterized membrane protein YjdF